MKALVIYDSLYGNTEQIAQAIGSGLRSGNEIRVLRAGDAKPSDLKNLDLLIVGSPTQKFRPTEAIKKLLASIPRRGLEGVRAAAFDTRFGMEDMPSRILPPFVRIFGYAAKPIAHQLAGKGAKLIASPEGFFVKQAEGPLKPGELERAARWAGQILAVG